MNPPEDRCEAKSSIPQPFVWDRLSVRLWALFFLSLLAILASACLLPEDSAFPNARPLALFLFRFSLPVRYPFKSVSLVLVVMQLICRDGPTNESIVIAIRGKRSFTP
jgi:hypothetical protein